MPRASKAKGTRKVHETRVVYRARTRKPIKRSVVRSSKSKVARSVVVPWEARVAPTDEQMRDWDAWLNEREAEFEEKYAGRYLAIWDRQVIAVAPTRAELYALADQVKPEVIPLVTYVPRAEDMRVLPSNFPIGWDEKSNAKHG